MAKDKTAKSTSVPRFIIDKPTGRAEKIAVISVPRVNWDYLPAALEKLISQVNDSDTIAPKSVRGTLTLY